LEYPGRFLALLSVCCPSVLVLLIAVESPHKQISSEVNFVLNILVMAGTNEVNFSFQVEIVNLCYENI